MGSDLDPNCLTLIVFMKELFEKFSRRQEKHEKLPSIQRVNILKLRWLKLGLLVSSAKNVHIFRIKSFLIKLFSMLFVL